MGFGDDLVDIRHRQKIEHVGGDDTIHGMIGNRTYAPSRTANG